MLEAYFVRPQTVDRVRVSWIGPEIERYVTWLAERGYSSRSVLRRVPLLVDFAEFGRARGARVVGELPVHIDAFVAERQRRTRRRDVHARFVKEIRGPVEQMLRLVVPGYLGSGRGRRPEPFADALPGFFEYLDRERGLRPASIGSYQHHLARFEAFLSRIGVARLSELSPAILSAFIAERAGAGLAKTSLRDCCGVLRVFLRCAHREGAAASDLSGVMEWPQAYRLSGIPRSITWEEVGRVLAGVDRRTPCGKRDWAILMLLVTYGLRGREVAALALDDIDWKHERLAVPERKAGHSTAFLLSASVGEALVDYLRNGRPTLMSDACSSGRSREPLPAQGRIDVPRPGSHTLRHTCVQRLVDADFALKTIGDFVGHRSAQSTEIYTKVAVEPPRQVALGDGEEVLS